jgi:hypothetical protein
LGERLLCKQEVDGSIPFTSTSLRPRSVRRVSCEAREGEGGRRCREPRVAGHPGGENDREGQQNTGFGRHRSLTSEEGVRRKRQRCRLTAYGR